MTGMNVDSFRDLVLIYTVSLVETGFRSSAELSVSRIGSFDEFTSFKTVSFASVSPPPPPKKKFNHLLLHCGAVCSVFSD